MLRKLIVPGKNLLRNPDLDGELTRTDLAHVETVVDASFLVFGEPTNHMLFNSASSCPSTAFYSDIHGASGTDSRSPLSFLLCGVCGIAHGPLGDGSHEVFNITQGSLAFRQRGILIQTKGRGQGFAKFIDATLLPSRGKIQAVSKAMVLDKVEEFIVIGGHDKVVGGFLPILPSTWGN